MWRGADPARGASASRYPSRTGLAACPAQTQCAHRAVPEAGEGGAGRGGARAGGRGAGEVVVPVPSPRHVKVGESVQCSLRPAWSRRDGLLVVVFGRGFGHRGPAVAAFHRGGDAETALPAAGAPDDGTLLGEDPRARIWTLCLLFPVSLPHRTCWVVENSRVGGPDCTLVSLGQVGRNQGDYFGRP